MESWLVARNARCPSRVASAVSVCGCERNKAGLPEGGGARKEAKRDGRGCVDW